MNKKIGSTPTNINEKLEVEDGAQKAPSKLYLGAVRRIMKYLAGTNNHGQWFKRAEKNKQVVTLKGNTHSDWAGCLDDKKSVSTQVFFLGSAVITWSSKKQHAVALSSIEAEYVAAAITSCQAIWIRRVLADFG
ncbi:secreted RxLR effector protein 161-like [Bidens hawaiensis]|uniref:secreted RxLR effector protein 161-like n=1 Tax=Bidens hawaiensis TaxID=980011 RepID=UPI00404AB9C3